MDIFQALKSFVNKQEVILIDYKGRTLKIGERVCIQQDIPSVDGMLYKNTICKIDTLEESKLRVQDRSGKLWWVGYNQVSASFL